MQESMVRIWYGKAFNYSDEPSACFMLELGNYRICAIDKKTDTPIASGEFPLSELKKLIEKFEEQKNANQNN